MKILKTIAIYFIPLKQIFASMSLTFLFRIIGLGLSFLSTFIITTFYGQAAYGNYSLAFTLAQVSAMIFSLGIPNAIISYLGLKSIDDSFSQFLLKKGLKILLSVSVIPFLIYFFGARIISGTLFNNSNLEPYIILLAFTVPVMIVHEFILYFFIATKNFLKFSLFMFIVPNILWILLLCFKQHEGHYVLVYYFGALLVVLFIEFYLAFRKHTTMEEDLLSTRQIIKFSSPMMFSSIMLFLLNWTDIFMLGAMRTEEEVGLYNLAYKIASLNMLVIISMNVVIVPKIAELYNSKKMQELHTMLKKTTHLIIGISGILYLFLILFSGFILSIFGSSFEEGKTAMIIISTGFLINAMTGTVDQVLNMTGNQKILKNITIFGFLINVILNFVLIPYMGINGAAIASLTTNVIFNVICLFYIKKRLGFYTFI